MGLGLGTSVLVLMFVMSFALYLGTPEHTSSAFLDWMSGNYTYQSLWGSLSAGLLVATAAGLVAFAFGRDIMTPLVVAVSTFLISFFLMPLDVLNEATIPSEFKVLLIGTFGVMYLMAMASFIRGSGGSP